MPSLTRPNEGDLVILADVADVQVEFLSGIQVNVFDFDAIHDNLPNEIALITGATPSAGDFFVFEDASDSYAKKRAEYTFLTGNEVPNDYAAPDTPSNVSFVAAQASLQAIWDKNTEVDMDNGFGEYHVEFSTDNFATVTAFFHTSSNIFYLASTAIGTTYYMRVSAVDAWGNISAPSAVLSATLSGIATSTITNFNTTVDERARDAVGTALVAGNNIDITVNDGSDTITVDVEALTSADVTDFAEAVSDQVGTMVTSNTETGITVTYQDSDNTLDFELSPTYSTSTVRLCDWSLGSFVEWDLGTAGTARMKYIKIGKKVEGWIYVAIDEDYLVPSGYLIVVHPDDMPYTPKAETFASGYPQPGGFGVLYRADDSATPGNEGYRHGLSPVVADIGTGQSVMIFFRTESASNIASSLDNNWSPLFGTPVAANNYYNSQYVGYFVYETTD